MYVGPYSLSEITKSIEEFDPLTPSFRRSIVDAPVILFGIAGVIVNFYFILTI